MKTYELPVTMKITQEEVDDILDAALSWCSYWCDFLEIYTRANEDVKAMSEVITREGTLKFHIDEPYEEGGRQDFVLTLTALLKGIADYGEYDFENFDGPMADAVLQQALFGEVVYG